MNLYAITVAERVTEIPVTDSGLRKHFETIEESKLHCSEGQGIRALIIF